MQSRIRSRLLLACKQLGIDKPKDFQAATGFPYRTAQSYLNGTRTPNAEGLAEICTRLRINLNWLLTGIGEPFVSTTPPAPVKLAPAAAVLREPQGAYHVEAPLNERERQLLEDFRSANEQGQNAIEDAAKAMAAIAALAKNKVG